LKSYKELVEEAHETVENYRQQSTLNKPSNEAEIARLGQEFELANSQLVKTQALVQKYESQLALYDRESREYYECSYYFIDGLWIEIFKN